ncbi:hypothetical protein HHK36_019401 [Tetracentron sinense]|uniref:Protein FAR1-RELATED SEQUENCE n=1 Tax=Tetracentron sinense TaxID=13715 RepID=A0A834YXA8_TETSI|nr:hypothetical protein HHK36_019401 [Tetracentron sinense]
MSKQYNGYQKVGCLEKDVRNQIDRERRLGIEAGDAQAMLEHFIHMQKENPNFFYSIDLNDDQSVRNVFWVDAKGRDDYIYFGDVVSFDSTYLTNKYKMPFAPFIGVNHHFQSILLGCAIIADETTSTYVWLMRTWLKAMGGKAPKAIVTDQDKAMKAAIAEVFPNSRHRFCLWHIMRKIPEKLGHVTRKYENFMAQLNKCIYKSWTEEQFENRWWKMVETFELGKNGWIKSLYEDRKQWVPTYMRDTFFAGMSTTQRSESINSFFDKYVQRKTTLKEFIEQYKVALQDRHERESKANFDTWNRTPILKSHSPYEKQMSTVYTHEIFKKFQREVLEIVACHPKKEEEDETVTMFMVHDFEANEDFIVEWEEAESKVSCLCRLFEYKGFLCRHAMTILQFSAVSKIPSHYILNRWSNNAKSHNIEAPALEEVKSVMPKLKVLDPQVTKTKGAPKRIKSGIEKKRKKNNTSKKDKENSNSIVSWPSIDGYCTTQQSIQGQSTSMSLNFDGYVLQQSMQGLLQSMHDDLIFTGNNLRMFQDFKDSMVQEFEMTDIMLKSYYLGIEVKQDEGEIFISQEAYSKFILKKFNMEECNPVRTPVDCGIKLSKHDEGKIEVALGSIKPTSRISISNQRNLQIALNLGLKSTSLESPNLKPNPKIELNINLERPSTRPRIKIRKLGTPKHDRRIPFKEGIEKVSLLMSLIKRIQSRISEDFAIVKSSSFDAIIVNTDSLVGVPDSDVEREIVVKDVVVGEIELGKGSVYDMEFDLVGAEDEPENKDDKAGDDRKGDQDLEEAAQEAAAAAAATSGSSTMAVVVWSTTTLVTQTVV